MALYYEAADMLKASTTFGGSLKSRVFSKKDFKAAPVQIYALAIETCKWSAVLKEVVDKSGLLRLERKVRFRPNYSTLYCPESTHTQKIPSN